jgi:hypothetical protein
MVIVLKYNIFLMYHRHRLLDLIHSNLQKHPPTYTPTYPTMNMFNHLSLHPYLYPSACTHLRSLWNHLVPSIQLLFFWTLPIVLFLFKHNNSETGFCLHLQVGPSQLGSIDRASSISPDLKHKISETAFCLRLQVEPSELGPIDRASSLSPDFRTPVIAAEVKSRLSLCWYHTENFSSSILIVVCAWTYALNLMCGAFLMFLISVFNSGR